MSADDDNGSVGEPLDATKREAGFRSGDRIGRYVLISSMGQGGMGVEFLAYDPELDRKVALKLLCVGMLARPEKQRLVREAQALARLSHPNVEPVHDVGTVDDQPFVTMEYVEGQTLKRWLTTPRPWREIVAVLRDAARGLAAAHAAGLVHRDFKPDNVLIGADGRVRVVDFSLTRVAGVDDVLGTPAYMAPEQLADGICDDRADQFSFGVTLYEALYRKKPYDLSDAVAGALHPAQRGAADPPRHSDVPAWVHKIVMRALSYDPLARFGSMDALLAALDRDPALPRRRILRAAAMALALGLGAAGFVRSQTERRRLCEGARDQVQKAWSGEARERVRLAFGRTGLPYAEMAVRSLARVLDQYATDWSNQYKDACAATRVRGETSEEVLDLRMACLGDRLKELAALVSVMEHPDADTVREAARAGRQLTPVSECGDVAALRAPTPRPRDPQQARRVDELQRRLAAMQAQHAVGKNTAAIELGEPLLADARVVGWPPLTAEVELWLGRAWADQGDESKSIPRFKQSFAAALGGGADKTLKQAAVRLAQEFVYRNDLAEFAYWERVAQAALSRGAPEPRLASFLEHTHCVALTQTGRVKERLRCLEQHAQRAQEPLNEWELTMLGLAADDAGQPTQAIDWLRQGVDHSLHEYGASHPRTLEMRAYLCKGLLDLGEYGQALAECQSALRLLRDVAPDNAHLVARVQLYLGATLRELKRYGEAKRLLLEALQGVKPEGEVLVELAQIASATGDHAGALAYFRKSVDGDVKQLPAAHPNLIVDRVLYGEALLASGDREAARAQLAEAEKVRNDDLSPLMVADVDFAYARALWLTRPADRPKALELARSARRTYAQSAPQTQRYQAGLQRIDRWLADEAERRAAPMP